MNRRYTTQQLAEIVGGELRGDELVSIEGIAEVSRAEAQHAVWVSKETYARKLGESKAGVVLVPHGFADTPMPAILCENLDRSIAKLLGAFAEAAAVPGEGIHPTAIIHPTAKIGAQPAIGPHVVIDADVRIGKSCVIHSGVFIGRGAKLGDECFLWSNAVVRDGCTLGDRVTIHANAVIGSDGFGYYVDQGRHQKFPHGGGVVLGDDVEIGACSCVDRAKFGNTVVGRGTKIDNLVQVAHNVTVGEDCVLAAQAGIGGSTRVGNRVAFGGKAGVIDNIEVGEGAQLGAAAVATSDVAPGITVAGWPAQEVRRELRAQAHMRRLPQLVAQVKELVTRVEQLETATHHNP